MSSNSDHIQINTQPTLDPTMSMLTAQLRRARPSQVQTSCSPQPPATVPGSAISASSVASSSRQGSPIMSPETAVLTTNSSVQVSPEPIRPRDEDQCPTNFQLPESILSRKTSANSLGQSWVSTTSPIAEAASNNTITANTSTTNLASSSKGNLIRRLSSRASRRITSRRRQSSAAPTSRDGSIGPCFLRRRSDSNNNGPPDFPQLNSDSESEMEEKDEFAAFRTMFYLDGPVRDSSANSITGSINGSSTTMDGPVIPLQLQRGTWVKKISKSRLKRVCLVYEPDSNKLIWDRSRPHKFLHVDEVREIRFGSDIHQYSRDFKVAESDRPNWFSILYSVPEKSKSKLLHLVADDAETRNTWTAFLDAMLKHRQDVMTSLMSFNDKAIAQFWQSEMSKQFGGLPQRGQQEELDVAGVMRVCQNLHIYSSQATLQANFHLSDARRREKLNFAEFLDFVRRMKQRHDVQRIIRSIAARPELGVSLDEFLAFLRDTQGENVDSNRLIWEKYFATYVRKYKTDEPEAIDSSNGDLMSEIAFVGFLASSHNMPLAEEPLKYTLDRPMNEYFISSSHNTYLLGRQVAGQSSIEGYINALVRGCRCVEVDCWDGSDGQPQVVHGRTLTSAISFKEVMKAINKYAFVKSRFPLWISLEVHCSPTQQAIMTENIKEAFGARLVTEQLDSELDKLPSPSQMMERILIKVKKPQGPQVKEEPIAVESNGRRRGNSLTSPVVRPAVPDTIALTPSQSLPQSPLLTPSNQARRLVSKSRVNTITEGEVQDTMSSSTSDTESGSDMGSVRKSSNKTVKILGNLGVYCAGVKFAGFDAAEAKRFNHIFSFMESSFAKHSRNKDEKMALDIHNMRYLMRVYPDSMRLGSSNFDPLIYWRRGVQMNAMNWQTFDLGMQLNHAMFEGGKDSSGYVLKPTELRDIQVLPFNSDIAEGKKERSVVSFSIDVVSAQQLMRPANLAASKSMDPYIEVEVFHANDKRDKMELSSNLTHEPDSPLKVQTEVIRENGFNPMFTNGQFKFKVTTKHPELIFVRWSVRLSTDGESYNNRDRPPIATYMAKLANMKQGYRTLPLLNHAGDQYLFSTLFCKINVDPIEKKLIDAPRWVPDRSKLNRLGGKVFGRGNTSPRGTIEKNSEKTSFESNT